MPRGSRPPVRRLYPESIMDIVAGLKGVPGADPVYEELAAKAHNAMFGGPPLMPHETRALRHRVDVMLKMKRAEELQKQRGSRRPRKRKEISA